MGLFGLFESGRKRFARQVADGVRAQGWAGRLDHDEARFQFDLGASGPVDLEPLFEHWSNARGGSRQAALDHAVSFVMEAVADPSWEACKDLLVPLVRADDRLGACYGTSDQLVSQPLIDGLAIMVGVDRPHSLTVIGAERLTAWERAFPEVLEASMANLRRREPLAFERDEDGFHVSAGDDYNDVSRLLIPQALAALDLKGSPVAIAVTRDVLVVAGSEEPEALNAMALYARAVLERHGPPVLPTPLILVDGAWRAYEAAGPAFGALSALRAADLYEQERPRLVERLQREGRSAAVAGLVLLPEGEGISTVALWTEAESLIPRADYVVIRTGSSETLARAWGDVEAAIGTLPREPNTIGAFYLAGGWPSAETLDRLAAASTPEWAEGRGVGVAGGRLTLFG